MVIYAVITDGQSRSRFESACVAGGGNYTVKDLFLPIENGQVPYQTSVG